MTGLQGEVSPSQVRTANAVTMMQRMITEIGRRDGARSPRGERNGSAARNAMPTGGPTRIRKVSESGGSKASTANNQRKRPSGRGATSMIVGLGTGPGPNGPYQAASPINPISAAPQKTMSRRAASGKNGTPVFLTRLSYSSR